MLMGSRRLLLMLGQVVCSVSGWELGGVAGATCCRVVPLLTLSSHLLFFMRPSFRAKPSELCGINAGELLHHRAGSTLPVPGYKCPLPPQVAVISGPHSVVYTTRLHALMSSGCARLHPLPVTSVSVPGLHI